METAWHQYFQVAEGEPTVIVHELAALLVVEEVAAEVHPSELLLESR